MPLQPAVLAGGAKADMSAVPLGQPYPCASPQLFHWLLPGSWALEVVGRDAAGNAAPPLQAAWTVAFGQAGVLYTRFLRRARLGSRGRAVGGLGDWRRPSKLALGHSGWPCHAWCLKRRS